MKICNECKIEKNESEFYVDPRSATPKVLAKCKICTRLISKRNRKPRKQYISSFIGLKTCNICNIEKNITDFNIIKTNIDGRNKSCKNCYNLAHNIKKRQNKIVYKPTNISLNVPVLNNYPMNNCIVCNILHEMVSYVHRKCYDCSILVKNITINLAITAAKGAKLIDGETRTGLAHKLAKLVLNNKSCFYCERNLTQDNPRHIDHIIPIFFGGNDYLENLVISCKECNFSKNKYMLSDWFELCKVITNNSINFNSYTTITYNKKQCRVCGISIPGKSYCKVCAKITRKLFSSLTATRNGASIKCPSTTIRKIAQLWINSDKCCYCNKFFDDLIIKSTDHIIPYSISKDNTYANIAISCLQCNKAKTYLKLDDWIKLCNLVSNNTKLINFISLQ